MYEIAKTIVDEWDDPDTVRPAIYQDEPREVQLARAYLNLHTENERLRKRLLTAAGDDLCRLTQEEIKSMSLGVVKIPPEDEFLASCKRFHAQVANEVGVMEGCLTLAQLVAENERLRAEVESLKILWEGLEEHDRG